MKKEEPDIGTDQTMDLDGDPSGLHPSVSHDFGSRYEVLSLLGVGGMGEVYQVRDRELDEVVALKTLKPQLLDDPRSAMRFRREVKLARRVTHPNVARIHDLKADDGQAFLTMEFIDGESLGSRLRSGAMPWREVTPVGKSICEGLAAAHMVDVIHRDLKPDNVMIASDGRVVLTDFGIATTREVDVDGEIVGTPHYVAPEQARGEAVDERADIYAFGCVLWEMLMGHPAWRGQAVAQIVLKRLIEPPEPLDPDLEIPDELRTLVQACMARERDQRPRSARSIAKVLSSIGENEPMTLILGAEPATNLAPRSSAFVGRRGELEELDSRLSRGERLVVLLGPGGTGKTRLSQEFGLEAVAEYPGGVWFFDLSEASTSDDVHEVAATVLDVPLRGDDAGDRIGRALNVRGKSLLILDNLEQVVDEVSLVLPKWLEMAPDVSIVATSRVRLGLEAEWLMPIDPLSLETAVELFEQRVQQVRPRYQINSDRDTVEEIVERVDRLPLAIELAAAQMRMIDADRLLERLRDRFRVLRSSERDRPERHKTMRGVLDGSWELLSPSARLALSQLSVFRGGATIDAACRVIDLSEIDDGTWPEETLEELWDHSLLRWVGPEHERLVVLESVREYAADRLDDPQGANERHAAFFAELGREKSIEAYHGPGGAEQLQRLVEERENVQTACRRAVDAGLGDAAVATFAALTEIRHLRGQYDLTLGEAVATMELDRELRVRALRTLASAYRWSGRMQQAREAIDEAHRLAADLGLELEMARLKYMEGLVLWSSGEPDHARDTIEGLFETFAGAGEHRFQGSCAQLYSGIAWAKGEFESAKSWLEKAVTLFRRCGDQRSVGAALMNQGLIHAVQGHYDQGIELYRESLAILRDIGDQQTEGLALVNLAMALAEAGVSDKAYRRRKEALEIFERTGEERWRALVLASLGTQEVEAGDLDRGRERLEKALLITRATGDRKHEGLALSGIALAHDHAGEYELASSTYDEAEQCLREAGDRLQLGWLLTKAGLYRVERGETERAKRALEEAQDILDSSGASDTSALAKHIDELRQKI